MSSSSVLVTALSSDTRHPAVSWDQPFHLGFFVPDIEVAVAWYRENLGLTFVGPVTVRIARFASGDMDGPLDVRVAMSREGPFHVELMEQTGSGFYGVDRPGGFNHAAVWVENLEVAIETAERAGLEIEARLFDDAGQMFAVFVRDTGNVGMRIELVPVAARAAFEASVAGD
jgi:catechol 2,3-dioxygenase-like lactoylglutathione lyase family enzyme